jgi:hypothetical protein
LGLFCHFTATHGYKFSTAINFLKLPHLRKVAMTTATWQPCLYEYDLTWAQCTGCFVIVWTLFVEQIKQISGRGEGLTKQWEARFGYLEDIDICLGGGGGLLMMGIGLAKDEF